MYISMSIYIYVYIYIPWGKMKPHGLKVKVDAIGGHYVKWSKPGSETQRPYVFSCMWKI
jgi:hypothetical protein